MTYKVEAFKEISSTQDEIRNRIVDNKIVNGLVIRAEIQTKGRGRFGREWQSASGGSYQSIAIEDSEGIYQKQSLSSAIAVGLAQEFSAIEMEIEMEMNVGIKWPNDLYVSGKKVAGILPEYFRGYLILGIGVNALNDVPSGGGQLALEVETVHELVLAGVERGLELSQHPITKAFAPFDLLNNQSVTLKDNKVSVSGLASGIDANGCLKLLVDGEIKTFCTGTLSEFSLREF